MIFLIAWILAELHAPFIAWLVYAIFFTFRVIRWYHAIGKAWDDACAEKSRSAYE